MYFLHLPQNLLYDVCQMDILKCSFHIKQLQSKKKKKIKQTEFGVNHPKSLA